MLSDACQKRRIDALHTQSATQKKHSNTKHERVKKLNWKRPLTDSVFSVGYCYCLYIFDHQQIISFYIQLYHFPSCNRFEATVKASSKIALTFSGS